ncbi:DDE-3 domain-containing protein [Mycena chlorophos]|uniref:DDE-3 domain-containing protein n=1 Tax=Mycena chlorophos TaxID=658473 RepID=A0A8H6S1F9_MYCCL|nr:DDE-3 domain-containing protein [Mycena chlorophos]
MTPTKRAIAQVLHDDVGLTFREIAQRTPFKEIQPNTINANYNVVKAHGGDFYYNGKMGNTGRKPKIGDGQLAEAVERVDSGELLDAAEVQRKMFPGVAPRTHKLWDDVEIALLRGFEVRQAGWLRMKLSPGELSHYKCDSLLMV